MNREVLEDVLSAHVYSGFIQPWADEIQGLFKDFLRTQMPIYKDPKTWNLYHNYKEIKREVKFRNLLLDFKFAHTYRCNISKALMQHKSARFTFQAHQVTRIGQKSFLITLRCINLL